MTKRLSLLCLLALCLLGSVPGARAQAVIRDDTFLRGPTALGSGANSTTGVPGEAVSGTGGLTFAAPDTGGAWIDHAGNVWNINSSNVLLGVPTSPVYSNVLYLPATDNLADIEIDAKFVASASTFHSIILRNRANNTLFFEADYSPGDNLLTVNEYTSGSAGVPDQNGSTSGVVNTASYSGSAGAVYWLKFKAKSTDSTHTTLTATLSTAAAPNTPVATVTITGNTTGPQSTASASDLNAGISSTGGTAAVQWQEVQVTNLDAAGPPVAPGVSFSGTTSSGTTVAAAGAVTGGTPTYSAQYQRSADNGSNAPTGSGSSDTGWTSVGSAQSGLASGATPTSQADSGLSSSTKYWYRLKVTDSAGTPNIVYGTASSVTTSSAPVAATGYSLTLSSSSGNVGSPVTLTYTLTPGGGTSPGVTITPAQSGVSGSFSSGTLTLAGGHFALSTATPSGTITFTPSTAGTAVFTAANASDGASVGANAQSPASQSYTANAVALSPGVLSLTSSTPSLITLSVAAPSGGTGTGYGAQVYRSLTSGYTPPGSGTAVGSAQTAFPAAVTDTPPDGRVYYYRIVYTDSASTSALSAQLPALLYDSAPVVVGFIGDSITGYGSGEADGYTSPWQETLARLQGFGVRSVLQQAIRADAPAGIGSQAYATAQDQHQDGSTTADWLPTSTRQPGYTTGSTATNLYHTAVSAFASIGAKYIHVMLGTNDSGGSVSAATYGGNLSALCAGLLADVAGCKVILSYPSYDAAAGQEGQNVFLQAYQAQIDGLINGTTILRGDTNSFRYFSQHPDQLTGQGTTPGVHPSMPTALSDLPGPKGVESFGQMWSVAIAKAMGWLPAGTTGTTIINSFQPRRGR